MTLFYQCWREKRSGHSSTEGKSSRWRIRKPLTREKLLLHFCILKHTLSLSDDFGWKYQSRTFVSFVLGILFLWQAGNEIPFHFVFHSIIFVCSRAPFWMDFPLGRACLISTSHLFGDLILILSSFWIVEKHAAVYILFFLFSSLSDDWHIAAGVSLKLVRSVLHTRRCWRTFEDDSASSAVFELL